MFLHASGRLLGTVVPVLFAAPALAQPVFEPGGTLDLGDTAIDIASADLDSDGDADLVVALRGDFEAVPRITTLLGDGSGSFAAGASVVLGSSPRRTLVADVDADGAPDAIAVWVDILDPLSMGAAFLGDGAGGFLPPLTFETGGLWPTGATRGDFNEDGVVDLAVVHGDFSLSILFGDGTGRFSPAARLPGTCEKEDLSVADFDEDGHADIVIPLGVCKDSIVRFGDGTGWFPRAGYIGNGCPPLYVDTPDVNGDGHADVVFGYHWRCSDGYRARVHLGNGRGGFGYSLPIGSPGGVSRVASADFNGDGWIDILAFGDAGAEAYLVNGCGSAESSFEPPGGYRNAAAIADFDGDGVPDFAAAEKRLEIWLNRTPQAPPRLGCIAGNANGRAGPPVDVLFVNDSAGLGAERLFCRDFFSPLEIRMDAPPSRPLGPARFALYAWTRKPSETTVTELPYGIGATCLPTPLTPGAAPQPRMIWNNIGRTGRLGAPLRPSSPAPSKVENLRYGVPRFRYIFIQGIILDRNAPNGTAGVTNGILMLDDALGGP